MSAKGSYRFERLAAREAELERLRSQAQLGFAIERGLIQGAGLAPGMDVLDLACGPGFLTRKIARMAAPGTVHGIDIDEELLEVARGEAPADGQAPPVTFERADVYEYDTARRFDFVYARFLFQHLSEPRRALERVRRLLRPGGRACALDVDDGWLTFSPGRELFERFSERAARGQRARGGDRRVGRRLPELMRAAGFSRVSLQVGVVTTDDLGAEAFVEITTGFKLEQIPEAERGAAAKELAEIRRLAGAGDVSGAVGVFVCTGRA